MNDHIYNLDKVMLAKYGFTENPIEHGIFKANLGNNDIATLIWVDGLITIKIDWNEDTLIRVMKFQTFNNEEVEFVLNRTVFKTP